MKSTEKFLKLLLSECSLQNLTNYSALYKAIETILCNMDFFEKDELIEIMVNQHKLGGEELAILQFAESEKELYEYVHMIISQSKNSDQSIALCSAINTLSKYEIQYLLEIEEELRFEIAYNFLINGYSISEFQECMRSVFNKNSMVEDEHLLLLTNAYTNGIQEKSISKWDNTFIKTFEKNVLNKIDDRNIIRLFTLFEVTECEYLQKRFNYSDNKEDILHVVLNFTRGEMN